MHGSHYSPLPNPLLELSGARAAGARARTGVAATGKEAYVLCSAGESPAAQQHFVMQPGGPLP